MTSSLSVQQLIQNHMRQECIESAREQRIALFRHKTKWSKIITALTRLDLQLRPLVVHVEGLHSLVEASGGHSQGAGRHGVPHVHLCQASLKVRQDGHQCMHAYLFISTGCPWKSNRTVISACLPVHLHWMSVKVKQDRHHCMPVCSSPLDVRESQTGPSSVHTCLFISTRCLWKSDRMVISACLPVHLH